MSAIRTSVPPQGESLTIRPIKLIELRDRPQADSWLAGGLCLGRLCPPNPATHLRVAPWLSGVLSNAGGLPPPGALADIGHLMTGMPIRALQPIPDALPELARAIHAYEDHVLGRLDADPRLDSIVDTVARMPPTKRDRAVALFTIQLTKRLGQATAVAISSGVVRHVTEMATDELIAIGLSSLTIENRVTQALVTGYRQLISGARRLGNLLSEAEVFLIENLDALSDLTQRIAIGQIIETADTLRASLPRRLKPISVAGRARIPTPLASEDNYPTGGFSALSTSGSIENLVISELIYMEDGSPDATSLEHQVLSHTAAEPARSVHGAVDLFDLRYAEGELLYYTRDESVFVRGHRVITFALMPDLTQARFKDPSMNWQRIIVVLGMLACGVHRLVEWLAREGLSFRIVFVAELDATGAHPLRAEQALCELSLRAWVEKGLVQVTNAPTLLSVLDAAAETARSARSDLIVISNARRSIQPPDRVLLGNLCVGAAEPFLEWANRGEPTRPNRSSKVRENTDSLWTAWLDTTLQLLQSLL